VWYYIDVHRSPISIQDRLSAFNGPKGASHAIAVALDEWYDPKLPLHKQQPPFLDSVADLPTNADLIALAERAEVVRRAWVGLAQRTVERVPELGVLLTALFVFLNAPLGSLGPNALIVKARRGGGHTRRPRHH
jgi:hypothetical protein